MFKWDTSITEGIRNPPILRVEIVPPPGNPDYDYTGGSLQTIAQTMLDRLRAQIIQWSLAQRQNARDNQLWVHQTHTTMPGASLTYTRMHGHEQLGVKLYPVPPIKKGGDELCLVIFHEGNKVTAVRMDGLDASGDWGAVHAATLNDSSWGAELIKVSQYKFDTIMGTILFSPIKVDKGVVSKAEHHHLCALRSNLTHFVESATLAERTPRINGADGYYYAPNDVFIAEKNGSQTIRLARAGEGGTGGFPYAITATGAYYYAPMTSTSWSNVIAAVRPGTLLSTDPFEQHAGADVWGWNPTVSDPTPQLMGNVIMPLADDTLEAYEELDVPASLPFPLGTLRYTGPRHGFILPLENITTTLDFLGGDDVLTTATGESGYGVWEQANYTVVKNTSTTLTNADTGEATTSDPEFDLSLPLSIFTQQDGLDMVEVVFTPLTASYNEVYVDEDNYSYAHTATCLDWEFFNYTDQTGAQGEIYSASLWSYPYYDWKYISVPENPSGYAWLVSYPPNLGVELGEYYFSDSHILYTPYGATAFPEPLAWGEKYHQSLMMWKRYTPWLHLSNGEKMLQGWELFGARKVYYRHTPKDDPVDVTEKLTRVTKTTADKIQALIIDVPLKRVKEFT